MGFLTDAFGAGEAKDAADAQAQGYKDSIATFTSADSKANQGFQPFTSLGRAGANNLMSIYGGGEVDMDLFRNQPGYQFQFDEGLRAVDNSGSARGMTLSGAQLKGLNRFGQGIADSNVNNYFNRQLALTNTGLGATNSLANINANYAGQIGAAEQGVGTARASGYLAKAGIKSGLANAALDVGTSWLKPQSYIPGAG